MVPPTERPPPCVIAERQERTAGSPLFTHTDSGHLHIRFTARQYAPSRFHLMGDVRLSCPQKQGAASSAPGMDVVLGSLEPLREQQLGGVGGLGDQEVEFLALAPGEVLEDEAGGVLATGRAADADAHPQVVLRTDGAGDRAQAVVAALSPAPL